MGDKTQLAILLLSAQSQSPWAIFFGSASALVTATLLSVLLGGWLGQVIPAAWVEWAAGVGFLMIGVYVLWREWQSARLERNVVNRENGSPASSFSLRPIANRAALVSFASILLAEMSDKTQLATLLLSARSQDLTVIFCGAAAALISASFLEVWAGAWVAQLIPHVG
jgi:putative Ca2+/H+ antiporter (TMEM165/GDT1 family)